MAVSPLPPPALGPLGAARDLPADLACPQCGYSLRGLPADGRCPECGAAVADALRRQTLAGCDPRWRAHLGSAAFAGMVVIPCVWLTLPAQWMPRPQALFIDALVALGVAGVVWLLSRPEPGAHGQANPWRLRWAARLTALLAAGAPLVLLAAGPWPSPGRQAAFDALCLTQLLGVALACAYFRWLARRIPDPRLATCISVLAWLSVLSVLLAIELVPWLAVRLAPSPWVARLRGGLGAELLDALFWIGWAGVGVSGAWAMVLLGRFRRACADPPVAA